MFCPKCGRQLPEDTQFCVSCGNAIPPAPVSAPVQAPNPTPVPAVPAPPAATAAPAKKKGKKGLAAALIALVLVLALAAVACFVWPGFLSGELRAEVNEERADSAGERAEAAMADEDYELAVEEYTAAIDLAAEDESDDLAELYAARAGAYMALEDYEAAAEDCEAALELDDSEWEYWAALADCYIAMDEPGMAIDTLEEGGGITKSHRLSDKLDDLMEELGIEDDGEQEAADSGSHGGESAPAGNERPESAAGPDEISIAGSTFPVDSEYICLSGQDLTSEDLEPLRFCRDLVELDLSDNDIDDLSALGELTRLEYLWLGENNISDLTPLENLTSLFLLDLYDNDISDIAPLAGLRNLGSLILWDNPVQDITPLAGLTRLTHLDLDETLVSDFTPLFELVSLQSFYLSGPNLPDDAWDQVAEQLPNFGGEAAGVGSLSFGWGYNEMFYEFEAQLATFLFEMSGCNGDIWSVDNTDELFILLESGQVDGIIGGLTNTRERAEDFTVTIPYYTDPNTGEEFCIFLPADDPNGLLPLFNEGILALQEAGMLQELAAEMGLALEW